MQELEEPSIRMCSDASNIKITDLYKCVEMLHQHRESPEPTSAKFNNTENGESLNKTDNSESLVPHGLKSNNLTPRYNTRNRYSQSKGLSINTSPTLIPFAPSPRRILARYPSSMHSISTVALSYGG